MKRKAIVRIVVWSLIIVLLAAVIISAIAASKNGLGGFQVGLGRFSLGYYRFGNSGEYQIGDFSADAGSVSEIEIEWLYGDVRVESYDGDSISVSEDAGLDEDDMLRYRIHDGKISIKYRKSGFYYGSREKDLVVMVPNDADLDELKVSAGVGELTAAGLSVAQLELEMVSGNAVLERISASKLSTESVSGKISAVVSFGAIFQNLSFSIDYLLAEWTSSEKEDYTIESILDLAKEYQEKIPDEEDAWLCEFEIYDGTNQREKGVAVLEEVTAKFRFCPRCWLRYADILMDRGEYEKAEPIIRKMCKNPKTTEKINASYMYFLDGQCKLQKLYNSDAYDNDEVDEKDVWAVYKAFKRALSARGLRENIKSQIEEYILALSSETGIEFPDEWRN